MIKELTVAIFLTSLVLCVPVFAEEDCKIAYPQFGTVYCEQTNNYDYPKKELNPSGEWSVASFTCVTECELQQNWIIDYNTGNPLHMGDNFCPGIPVLGVLVEVNGEKAYQYTWSGGGVGTWPINFDRVNNNLEVKLQCCDITGCRPLANGGSVKIKQAQTWLYDENPDKTHAKVENSKYCVPQNLITKYHEYSLKDYSSYPTQWYEGDNKRTISEFIGNSELIKNIERLPENMKDGDTYSYFYKWIEVPDINTINGRDGELSGYCGGSLTDRKLYSFDEVETFSRCYMIPTSIKRSVECCYNEDCSWKDPSGNLRCDPSTFTCTDKRPCNSDIECGEEVCSNFQSTTWSCDFSKPWYPYGGECKKSIKSVPCCEDSDCPNPSKQYCNRDEGCKDLYILIDCPMGMCCKEGGDYKPKDCPSNLECCPTSSPIIGECKSSCESEESSASQGVAAKTNDYITGKATQGIGYDISQSFPLIFFGIIILLVVGIYYLHNKGYINIPSKTKATTQKPISKAKKPEKKKIEKSEAGFCPYCGNKVEKGDAFCPECGRKV